MLGYYMATLWAWTVHLAFVQTNPVGGRQQSLEGDQFNKAAPAPPAPPPAPAAPAPATGENGASPADEHPTPPACEGAEAGSVQRTAKFKPGLRRR